jgi:hypothetical protein
MKFKKTKDMKIVDDLVNDLDYCGNKNCKISTKQLNKEGIKFLKNVTKKCRSNTIPKNKKEYDIKIKKYNKCFTKYKNRSVYNKNLTKRKKCEDKKCSKYQKKIAKKLASIII